VRYSRIANIWASMEDLKVVSNALRSSMDTGLPASSLSPSSGLLLGG
jgi:hypothetical protein